MKVVILAGGFGTRISEESHLRPKPMVEIGGKPMLWHIMKTYAHYGLTDFVVCLGYKGHVIQEYFTSYVLRQSDITVDLARDEIIYHDTVADPWRITLAHTGTETQTGGRLRRIERHLDSGARFCMTYGDGVGDIDIAALLEFHDKGGLDATLTAVRPPGRFGATQIDDGRVTRFMEKPLGDGGYINGGFFVLESKVLSRISSDDTVWEHEPLEGLARDGQLGAYIHDDFWRPMDTLRDKQLLEKLWSEGNAPWKVWA